MKSTKILSFIDLIVQTILLGCIVVMIIKVLWEEGWAAWEMALYFAMIGAMFLGPWQMLSSLITTAARAPGFRLRAIHFASSVVYLAIVYGADTFMNTARLNALYTPFTQVLVYGIPAALAIFYYYITITTP